MTTIPSEDDITATDRQTAARDRYLASVEEGRPLTGDELGRLFDRTGRWGRMQISQARAELGNGSGVASSATGNGSEPASRREEPGGNRDDPTEARDSHATDRGSEPTRADRNGPGPSASLVPTTHASPDRSPLRPSALPQPAPDWAPSTIQRERSPVALTVVRWLTTLTVIAIALAAGRASYDHQRAFAELAGEDRNAWSLPLSVDGMMLVASLTMLVRRWQNKPAGRLAWAALLLGGLASLAANITVAEPTLAGRLAAAWPPVCLLVSVELLLQQIRDGDD